MPSKSAKQAKFMRAVAHGWKPDRGSAPSKKVATEFMRADQKKGKYANGGLAQYQNSPPPEFLRGDFRNPETGDLGFFGGMLTNIRDQGRAQYYGNDPAPPGYGGGLGNINLGGLRSSIRPGFGYEVPGDNPATPTWPPEGDPQVGVDFAPGSVAHRTWEKYGIVDPGASEYDRFFDKAEPLSLLSAQDPVRQEYEGFTSDRAAEEERLRRLEALTNYGGTGEERQSSPYREQLRQHKSRVKDILGGGTQEEPADFQFGGLAAFANNPQFQRRIAQARTRGRGRAQPPQRGGRPSRMINRGRGPGPLRKPGGVGGPRAARMQQAMMRAKGMNRGRPPVRVGGPGGPMGGRQMISPTRGTSSPGNQQAIPPGDARMSGGQAMPYRGLLQKMRTQQRSPSRGGPNRIGNADQQGGLARAMQTQTGRPPISRRAAFPGSRSNQY